MPRISRRTAIALAALSIAAIPAAASAASTYGTLDWLTPGSTAQVRDGEIAFNVLAFPAQGTFSVARQVVDGAATTIINPTTGSDVIVADSAFGQVFGTSAGQDLLQVRVNTSTSANRTTATWHFAHALPPGNWAFSLGDIDVDSAEISATGPGGAHLSGAQVQGSVAQVPYDFLMGADPNMRLPIWEPGATTSTLRGATPGDETQGAGGWFRPSAAVSSLTVVFEGQPRAGTPSYRTWFAVLSYPVTGTVTVQGTTTPVPHAVLTLTDPAGNVMGVATTDAQGNYSLPPVYAQPGYTVQVRPPTGWSVVGTSSQQVSTNTGPAVANFQVVAGSGGSGGSGGGGTSHTSSVVGYSEGDAAIVVTPGVTIARPGHEVPMEVVTTCTSTTATVPTGLSIVSTGGGTRAGQQVTWAGSSGVHALTLRAGARRGTRPVAVSTTCADGSTASVTARIIVRPRVVPPKPIVPVTG